MARFAASTLVLVLGVCFAADTQAASNYFGKFIGPLKQFHHALAGDVYVVDSRTLHIRNLNYDGEGPAAYFYVSNGKTPNEHGIKLRDERGSTEPLKRYRKKHITLALPEGKTISNIKWFYVWCDEFSVNFGDVKMPKNFEFPKPQKISRFSGVHAVSSDNVVVVDAQTLLIPSFSYDGEAPDAKFWVGSGSKPTPQGVRVPDENGKEDPLRKYDKKTIVLTLPGDITVFDIGNFAIWCEAFTVDFGHIEIPKDLNVPPSLKMLGVSPQNITFSIPSSFHLETVSPSLYSELLDSEASIYSTAANHTITIRDTSNDKQNSSAAGYIYNNARQSRLESTSAPNCSRSSNNGLGTGNPSVNSTNTPNGTRADTREAVEILLKHGDVEPIKLVQNGTVKPRLSEPTGAKNYSDLAKLIRTESIASDGAKENATSTGQVISSNSSSNSTSARVEAFPEDADNGTKSTGSVEIIKSISMEYPETIGRKFGSYGAPGFGDFGAISSTSFSRNTVHQGSTVSKIIDLSNDDGHQYDNLYSLGEGFGLKNSDVRSEKRRKPSRKPPRSEKYQSGVAKGDSKKSRGRGRSKKSQSEKVKVPSVSASDINSMLFWNDSPSGRRLTANDDTVVEATDWDGNRFSFDIAVGEDQ